MACVCERGIVHQKIKGLSRSDKVAEKSTSGILFITSQDFILSCLKAERRSYSWKTIKYLVFK